MEEWRSGGVEEWRRRPVGGLYLQEWVLVPWLVSTYAWYMWDECDFTFTCLCLIGCHFERSSGVFGKHFGVSVNVLALQGIGRT
jgi:hypothetical protein